MSTIGLLSYAMSHCNNNENNINNINSNNNNNNHNNNNNLKIKTMNQSFYGNEQSEIVDIENRNKCDIIIVRKRPKLLPLGVSNNSSVNCVEENDESTVIPMLMTDQKLVKRPKIEKKVITKLPTKGRALPQPVAVARRNARERNRVKQVNNGFETLRQHIPNDVAEAFEAAGNGRGASKKLSKVETLKMAVEYIRSLEELLAINRSSTDEELNRSSVIINSPPLSESDTNGYSFNTSEDHDEHMSMCSEPEYTTIDGLPYIRIPGTTTYQLITTTTVYDDEDNNPITIVHQNLSDDFSTADNMETPMGNNCDYMQSKPMDIMAPALLNSFSGQTIIPVIAHTTTPNTSNDSFKQEYTIVAHSPSTIDDHCNMIADNKQTNYKGTMTLKHEIQDVCDEDGIFDDTASINENSMFEAMYLWNQQQQQFKMKDSE